MSEIVKEFVGFQDPETAEHSAYAKAKKVIDGPAIFPADTTDAKRSINPIQTATGAQLTLLQGKAYRMISDVDIYFRQSAITGAVSVIGDIYLPAKTSIVISTEIFPFVATLAVGGAGFVQAVEVK